MSPWSFLHINGKIEPNSDFIPVRLFQCNLHVAAFKNSPEIMQELGSEIRDFISNVPKSLLFLPINFQAQSKIQDTTCKALNNLVPG